jgi:hypothetical protein
LALFHMLLFLRSDRGSSLADLIAAQAGAYASDVSVRHIEQNVTEVPFRRWTDMMEFLLQLVQEEHNVDNIRIVQKFLDENYHCDQTKKSRNTKVKRKKTDESESESDESGVESDESGAESEQPRTKTEQARTKNKRARTREPAQPQPHVDRRSQSDNLQQFQLPPMSQRIPELGSNPQTLPFHPWSMIGRQMSAQQAYFYQVHPISSYPPLLVHQELVISSQIFHPQHPRN